MFCGVAALWRFVMNAWGKSHGADEEVLMLADGNGAFTKALGLELDASGQRRQRNRSPHMARQDRCPVSASW